MNEYKKADILIQAILILIHPIGYILEIPVFFPGIILLGLVQLISALIHIRWGNQLWKNKMRVIYHWMLLIPVGLFVWAMFDTSKGKYDMVGIEQMLYLLLVSAVLALFYLTICIIEWVRLKKIN